jgi:hypothetical protein
MDMGISMGLGVATIMLTSEYEQKQRSERDFGGSHERFLEL